MEIQLICIGKTDDPNLQKLISNYENRLKHYIKFTLLVIPDIKDAKNLSKEQQKTKEGELIENQIRISDVVVLLDENGKEFSSVGFSEYLNKRRALWIFKNVTTKIQSKDFTFSNDFFPSNDSSFFC